MQLEEFSKICVGSVITCFIPYNDVKLSNWLPSAIVVSLDDQLLDLAFNYNFSKLVVNELKSSEV